MLELKGFNFSEIAYESKNALIYRGTRKSDNRPVIAKVLKADYPTREEVERFEYEYRIAKEFNRPGVLKLYSLENIGHSRALVMEDFGAIPLSENRHSSSINLQDFLEIALTITDIIGDIHQHNIIHKNITPKHILINPETKEVKITDFSIAAQVKKETQAVVNPEKLEGTLAYISPEQTGRMNRAIDYRTDFYSLGVTFYEMLTGELPFQANDPLELVHSHIAKQPPSPDEVKSEIPPAVAAIVRKLLAKNAEDRYQTAYGLKADLTECLEQYQIRGTIEDFQIGRQDISDRFQISQKLYGREPEMEALLAAFERVSQGKSEMMLVTGYSGIGKTVLVQEIHQPIVSLHGNFISGKFDKFKRNVPYSALIQAFEELIQGLLTESEPKLKVWQEQLLTALGPNGQVIIDVIPQVELIIGSQPPVPVLSPTEAQNRFNFVFQNFIRVLAQKEHPLVIFLDDLQWADSATLKLLQTLITDPETQHLFLIGAYRDNEVSAVHPLMLALEGMEKVGATINTITLTPLTVFQVNQMVSETLHVDEEKSRPLTELIFSKTHGNPFFVNQFLTMLYEEQLLTFSPPDWEKKVGNFFPSTRKSTEDKWWQVEGGWQWNLAKIQEMDITDNVAELMSDRIQKLSAGAQHILKLAASIGTQFDLLTLAVINEKSPAETATSLGEALEEGLIEPIHGIVSQTSFDQPSKLSYKFLHDRVQQAAYSLIAAEDKAAVHLRIGRLLLEKSEVAELEDKIFGLVNHLNIGRDFITQPEERLELALLNLIAGKKAKVSAAYQLALNYLQIGLGLLASLTKEAKAEAAWQKH